MSSFIRSKLRFILPASFGVAGLLSGIAYNESPKALKGLGKWQNFKIINIEQISPDTRKFTFELPDRNSVLGLKPASFVLTNVSNSWFPWNSRPYTPVSKVEEKGKFEIVVKHIPGGKISTKFFDLKNNDFVPFMGPIVKYDWKPNTFEEVNLLCGGSGITPMFQLIRTILENPSDNTSVRLFYANKTKSDILLHRELEEMKRQYPEKISLNFYVEEGPQENGMKKGYIPKEDLQDLDPNKKTMFFLCGPDPFIKAYAGQAGFFGMQYRISGILGSLGYKSNQVFRF